jgi:hypothetical protein
MIECLGYRLLRPAAGFLHALIGDVGSRFEQLFGIPRHVTEIFA